MLIYFKIAIIINLLFLALFLFVIRSVNRQSNIILGLILLFTAYCSINNIIIENQNHIYKYLIYTPFIVTFSTWPLLYFYILLNLGKKIKFDYKLMPHFIIPVLIIIRYGFYLLLPDLQKEMIISSELNHSSLEFRILAMIVAFAVVPFYNFLSIKAYLKEKNLKKEFYSSLNRIRINWIFKFIIMFQIINMLVFIVMILDISSFKYFHQYVPIVTSILFFYLVYKSLNSSFIFIENVEYKEQITEIKSSSNITAQNRNITDLDEKAKMIIEHFEKYKPYLNRDLNISNLAMELGMPAYVLSYTINNAFSKNFFDFINSYRVDEAKNKLIDPAYENIKIENIGYDSGFSSKANFYSIFKKYTELTPSEYRISHFFG